jgi:hypothetical protein
MKQNSVTGGSIFPYHNYTFMRKRSYKTTFPLSPEVDLNQYLHELKSIFCFKLLQKKSAAAPRIKKVHTIDHGIL